MIKKIIDKYKHTSLAVRASFWFAACSIIQKGISLLTTPIFTRIMTTEQYGKYSVYNSWYSIILILCTLNLSSGVFNNAITHYPEDRDEITSSFQGLSTTVTLFLLGVYALFAEQWTGILKLEPLLMIVMFAEFIFVPGLSFWTVSQRYDYKYRKLIFVTLLIAVLSPALGIVSVLLSEEKANARILAYAAVQICIGLIFYIQNLREGKKFYSRRYWKYALMFNLPLIPHYLSMTVLNQSDRIMISRMVGDSEAAIYNIAYTIAMLMNIITNAVNSSFVPYTYKELKAERYSGLRKNSNFLLALVGGLTILTMAFGPEITRIIAPIEYYDAIWVIPPVAASVYFMFLYPLFSNVEFFFNKTKYVMFASCIGAILNILLNYIFIGIYGYYAAGYTTLACYVVFAISHYVLQRWIIRREELECKEIYDTKFIALFSVVVLMAMVGMLLIYKLTIIRYSIVIVMIGVIIWQRTKIVSIIKSIRQ